MGLNILGHAVMRVSGYEEGRGHVGMWDVGEGTIKGKEGVESASVTGLDWLAQRTRTSRKRGRRVEQRVRRA
jgi:hypothetical protein